MGATGDVLWESDDRMAIDETPYVLMYEPADRAQLRLFKPRVMVEAYDPVVAEFQGANIFEIGIYSGGSTAYFAQRCRPRRIIAVDRSPERGADLDRFIDERGLADRVLLHHGVDQSDGDHLVQLATAGFGGEAIDLVIDDASHQYHPTVASFEALFPLVRPGGLYIIEDWTSDDWLVVAFAAGMAHTDPMARALVESWVATSLDEPDTVVSEVFDRWIVRALIDPASPHHDLVVGWRAGLDRPGAGEAAVMIRDRIERKLAAGDPGPPGPTVATLGVQLLLAVKGLCPAISSLTVTPWWIAARRGGPIEGEFTVESIGRDPLGVLGTHAAGHHREADARGAG